MKTKNKEPKPLVVIAIILVPMILGIGSLAMLIDLMGAHF